MLGFAAKNERTFPLSLTSPPATAKGGRRIRKAAEPLTAAQWISPGSACPNASGALREAFPWVLHWPYLRRSGSGKLCWHC